MAKKANKPPRKQVYREILEQSGINLDDCRVLGFSFKYEIQVELFHYEIMAQRDSYCLFDRIEKSVIVVVPFDERKEAAVGSIAERLGGVRVPVDLK